MAAVHHVIDWMSDIERSRALDRGKAPARRAVDAMPARARAFLGGQWLGHPLHPMLTDLPIGFWTTAWILDIAGGRRTRRVATVMVGLGVVAAVPTMAAGLVDWRQLDPRRQRVGLVHMAANALATGTYAASFIARCRGRRLTGIGLGWTGAAIASAGGYLGGHLAFGAAADATHPDHEREVTASHEAGQRSASD